MRSHCVAILACLVLMSGGGCRTNPAITMLENENRQLEDVIYQQRDIIEEYRRQLEACRLDGNVASASPSTLEGPSFAPTRPSSPSTRGGKSSTRPSVPDVVEPPVIEIPDKPTPPGQVPDTLRPPADGTKSKEQSPGFTPKPEKSEASGVPALQTGTSSGNARVAQITLGRIVAWDNDVMGSGGDQGLSIVVEPRDATGALVTTAAPISIVVLDPTASGNAARVARWDFSADEVARLLRNGPSGDGIPLEMVWPVAPPANSRLHLFVRYWTDDGRKVEADRQFDTAAADVRGPNWEPAGPELSLPDGERTAAEPDRGESTPSAQAPTRSLRTAAAPKRRPTLAPPRPPEWSPDRP